jgi:hypothetical protein
VTGPGAGVGSPARYLAAGRALLRREWGARPAAARDGRRLTGHRPVAMVMISGMLLVNGVRSHPP